MVQLCPCGNNPELHKMNNRQVDTVLQVTDRTADRPRSGRPRVTQPTHTAISASYTYITDSLLLRHLQPLALDMSSVVTLYVIDYDSMVSGPMDNSEG